MDEKDVQILRRQKRRETSSLRQCAKKFVISSVYRKYYKLLLDTGLSDLGIPEEILSKIKHMESLKKSSGPNYHRFITVSFPPCWRLIDIQKLWKKVLNKCWIGEYIYSYEQRYDGGLTKHKSIGDGLHIHLLVKNYVNGVSKRKSEIIREISSTLNIEKNFIDVRNGNEELYLKRIDYIKGKKSGEVKNKRMFYDAKFREDNNLSNYYTNAP